MKRYTLDPRKISLDQFKQLTRERKMIPSRVELQNKLEKRFEALQKQGIAHLGDLILGLNSKSRLESFAQKSGLPADYLALLKREAGSYLSRPFPLANFPGIPFEYTEVLKTLGLGTTRDFFEQVQTHDQQASLSKETGIPVARLKELFALCDLSRITGVGGVFARVVYEAGIKSCREFAESDARIHYQKYLEVIARFGYSAGHFSEDDIQYCIDYAKVVIQAEN